MPGSGAQRGLSFCDSQGYYKGQLPAGDPPPGHSRDSSLKPTSVFLFGKTPIFTTYLVVSGRSMLRFKGLVASTKAILNGRRPKTQCRESQQKSLPPRLPWGSGSPGADRNPPCPPTGPGSHSEESGLRQPRAGAGRSWTMSWRPGSLLYGVETDTES